MRLYTILTFAGGLVTGLGISFVTGCLMTMAQREYEMFSGRGAYRRVRE